MIIEKNEPIVAEKWLDAFRLWLADNINRIERKLRTASVETAEMEGGERVVFEFCSKGKCAALKEFLRLCDLISPEKLRLIADTIAFEIEELNGEYGFEIANIMHELRRLKIADCDKNPEFYFGSGRYPGRNNDFREEHLENFQISRGIFSQPFRTTTAFLHEAGLLEYLICHFQPVYNNSSYSQNPVITGAGEAVDDVRQYFEEYPEPQVKMKNRRASNHVEAAFYADAPDSAKWFKSPAPWSVSDVTALLSKKISEALSEVQNNAFRGGYIFTLATIRRWITESNPTSEELRNVFSYLLGAMYLQYSEHLPVSAALHYAMNGSYITRYDIFRFLFFDKRLNSFETEMLVDYGNADWSIFHPQFITASAFMLAAGGVVYNTPEGVKEEVYIRDRHSGILAACDVLRKGLRLSEIISDTTEFSIHRAVFSLISTFKDITSPGD